MHWVDFCSFSSAVWHTTFLNNGSSSPQHAGFDEDVLHLSVVGDGAVVSRLHLVVGFEVHLVVGGAVVGCATVLHSFICDGSTTGRSAGGESTARRFTGRSPLVIAAETCEEK